MLRAKFDVILQGLVIVGVMYCTFRILAILWAFWGFDIESNKNVSIYIRSQSILLFGNILS